MTAFLSNLGPSLAYGTAAQPGSPFGGGLGPALQGIEEQRRHNEQLQQQQQQFALQQQAAQRQAAAKASTMAYQTEETSRLNRLSPLEEQSMMLDLNQRSAMLSLANDPQQLNNIISSTTESLGQLNGDEQAVARSAKEQVTANLRNGKFDLSPMSSAVDKIAQMRHSSQGKPTAQVQYDQGIPVAVKGKDGSAYDVNDKNLPDELKPLVASAKAAHSQHVTEEAQKQGRAFAQQMAMFQKHLDAPSQSTKTMIDTAPGVEKLADKVIAEVNQQKDKLGPAASRWNDFWTNKAGAPNPEFKQLTVDTTLLRSLVVKMHIGSRSSDYMTQEFGKLIDAGKDSPENLLIAAQTLKSYAGDIASQAKDFGMNRKSGSSPGISEDEQSKVSNLLKKYAGAKR